MSDNLIEVLSVTQNFEKPDGRVQKTLDHISLNLKDGEILAILGKSGCGKSTLLRIISGLVKPTRGKVKFHHKANDKSFGISMVFQNFALFPWLTVLENVELGLEALDIPVQQRRKKALEAINLIGLNGFESSTPKELSGGMRQRVGFARALVVSPEVLLMDEPFSALDILTSDTLKHDFLELWAAKKTGLKSVLIVTHSIEEAVMMADRAIILSANPGKIASELQITLPRPRNPQSTDFHTMVDQIYSQMAFAGKGVFEDKKKTMIEHTLIQNLIFASPNQLSAVTGALILSPYNGSGELAELVKTLHIKTFDVIHVAEALSILKFATITDGNITLSRMGKLFAAGNPDDRKRIFAKQLIKNVPLAAYIAEVLDERPDNKAPRLRFQTHLEDYLSSNQAMAALNTMIVAGRYAEVFSYDDSKQIFSLDNI